MVYIINFFNFGGGIGLVDSILAFYSDTPSLNPAGNLNFLYENTKINKKRPGLAQLFKNYILDPLKSPFSPAMAWASRQADGLC